MIPHDEWRGSGQIRSPRQFGLAHFPAPSCSSALSPVALIPPEPYLLPPHPHSHSQRALPLTSVPSPNSRTLQVMAEAGGMGSHPRICSPAGRYSLCKQCSTKPRAPSRTSLGVLWVRVGQRKVTLPMAGHEPDGFNVCSHPKQGELL